MVKLTLALYLKDQMVELKKKPQPIFITLEDGSKKSVIIDPIATAQDLANLLVEDLADEISRYKQWATYPG